MTLVTRAFREAERLGASSVGVPHFVLVLLLEDSIASRVLGNLGITYDEVAKICGPHIIIWPSGEEHRGETVDGAGASLNPDAVWTRGRAEGLALAAGFLEPRPEDWLAAMVYSRDGLGFAAVLQILGVSRAAVIDSMRRSGIRLPPVDVPPFTKPTVTRRK